MKKFGKILVIALVVATLAGVCVAFAACDKNDGQTITMYTESGFAPYEFVSANGDIIGVDVAIMSQVAENLGMKLDIQDVSFDFIPQYVADAPGYAVGAAGLTINAERLETVNFSNVYASSTLVVISSSANSYDSVADLAGKRVGVQQGTSGDLIISAAAEGGYTYEGENGEVTVTAAGATVQRYSTYSLVYQELVNGRIDAILMDKLPGQSLLATQGGSQFAIIDATDLLQEDFGIAIKKNADEQLVNEINKVIDEWLANGNLEKYTEYYTAVDNYEKNGGEAPVVPEGLKISWNV